MYNSIEPARRQHLSTTLGVDPKQLADSAKSTAEKERLAASRVDAYLDRMMAGQAQPMSVPLPLKKTARREVRVVGQLGGRRSRGRTRARRFARRADSARTANQPKSQIPMPGWRRRPARSRLPHASRRQLLADRAPRSRALRGPEQTARRSVVGNSRLMTLGAVVRRRWRARERARGAAAGAAGHRRAGPAGLARRHRRRGRRSADHAVRSAASGSSAEFSGRRCRSRRPTPRRRQLERSTLSDLIEEELLSRRRRISRSKSPTRTSRRQSTARSRRFARTSRAKRSTAAI